MIHFVCTCGEPFDVPADQAGESLQCPVCRRLLDVPRLGDAGRLEDDGTVRLSDAPEIASDLESKFIAFGQRSDMRPSVEEFLISGTGDPATTPKPRVTPRYDPITGELMLPVAILNDDVPAAPVMDIGAPVLGYARTTPQPGTVLHQRDEIRWWAMPWRLLTGMSLMTLLILWFVHVGVVVGLLIPGFNVFFTVIAFFITLVIVAHYANTMEDFGPNDRDKVPVLMRSVSLGEDVFMPLVNCLIGVVYACLPLMLAGIFLGKDFAGRYPAVFYAGLAFATLVFPVAVFTAVCGGVIQNLTPRRMLSVVIAAPGRYVLACVTFWAAYLTYGVAFARTDFTPMMQPGQPPMNHYQVVQLLNHTAINLAIYAVAVFLMHLAAAWMGLIYRNFNTQFDWVLQRHDRAYRQDTMGELMRRRQPRHVPAANQERLQFVRNADAARRKDAPSKAVASPAPLPVLPIPPDRRHGGFEVRI